MATKHAPHVQAAGDDVIDCMGRLERWFPPGRFKLTFVARYVGAEPLDDADMVITADNLEAARAALARRIEAESAGG